MLLNAKNGTVTIRNTDMDYISFGTGNEYLIMIPGLGDGLATVKGTALPFSIAYRAYARWFKVFVFSRKNRLEDGYSTRDMAQDQVEAMKTLGIMKAHIIGISQGGMIAQYMGIDNPDVIHSLVLAVTLSKQNEGKITCPALVIGGDSDKIVGANSSSELAQGICIAVSANTSIACYTLYHGKK